MLTQQFACPYSRNLFAIVHFIICVCNKIADELSLYPGIHNKDTGKDTSHHNIRVELLYIC